MEYSTLSNKLKIPKVGFGTWKPEGREDVDVNRLAIEEGYRYFDTASYYGTEEAVGLAVEKSVIPREEFFLASKIAKTEMGYAKTKQALKRSLTKLKTDYLDLYLIHWPRPDAQYKEWKKLNIETWKAMEELYKDGYVKAIGVTNFLPHHIENIMQNAEISPMLNQIEFHPGYTQEATVQYCKEHGIAIQAWSPLGRRRVLEHPLLQELAQKYEVSTAKICLVYALQRNVLVVPKSSSAERMRSNIDVFDLQIEEEDMYRISTMPQNGWSGQHPDYIE